MAGAASSAPNPLLLADLPKVVDPELRELQRICIRLMRLEGEASFPGSQPVSFERSHLTPADDVVQAAGRRAVSLMRQEYYAAEKTAGRRYMLLILARGAFMIDRSFEMRRLEPMHFPGRKPGEPPLDTLLDGELVECQGTGGGGPRLRFLVYDACCVCGAALTAEPLPVRLMAARREVLTARYAAGASGAHDFSAEPFAIELKDFFGLAHLPHLLAHVTAQPSQSEGEGEARAEGRGRGKRRFSFADPLRKLRHGSDGIIFTPVRDAYAPGTCAAACGVTASSGLTLTQTQPDPNPNPNPTPNQVHRPAQVEAIEPELDRLPAAHEVAPRAGQRGPAASPSAHGAGPWPWRVRMACAWHVSSWCSRCWTHSPPARVRTVLPTPACSLAHVPTCSRAHLQDRALLVGYDWLTLDAEAQHSLAAGLAAGGRGDESGGERAEDVRVVECTFDPMHSTVRLHRRRRRRKLQLRLQLQRRLGVGVGVGVGAGVGAGAGACVWGWGEGWDGFAPHSSARRPPQASIR